jgi:hypothetical protein
MTITIDNFVGHPEIPKDAGIRQLNIHGSKSDDAIIEVYADGNLLETLLGQTILDPFYSYLGPVLYSFKFSGFPGCMKIKIKVIQGTVVIGQSRAKYPAKIINNKQEVTHGYFYLWQPMNDSKFLVKLNGCNVKDNTTESKPIYPLVKGDIMEYYHLFYKGTPYWILTLTSNSLRKEVDIYDNDLETYNHSDRDEVEIIKQELIKQNVDY